MLTQAIFKPNWCVHDDERRLRVVLTTRWDALKVRDVFFPHGLVVPAPDNWLPEFPGDSVYVALDGYAMRQPDFAVYSPTVLSDEPEMALQAALEIGCCDPEVRQVELITCEYLKPDAIVWG